MLKRQAKGKPLHLIAFCVAILIGLAPCAFAQDAGSTQSEREQAFQLLHSGKFVEAQEKFEKLAAANPSDAQVMFGLGFAITATSKNIKDADARRQARIRARNTLLRAKELGFKDDLLDAVLASLPPDGSEGVKFSKNAEADKAMHEGEAAFTRGDYDVAIAAYERALKLDPQLYHAALFIGDMYFQKAQVEKAGEWYARAIAIDPDVETAYRYWSDVLLKNGKMAEAREKAIEAIVAEPYNRMAFRGLIQWAQANKVSLAHPKIDIPTSVSSPKPNEVTITVDPKMMEKKSDGTSAWMIYGLERALWYDKKFKEHYPNEKTYRHSLAEETAALHLVAQEAKDFIKAKQVKQLDPSLANLIKLDDAGLLEAYILLARADDGIAQDFAVYRKANRDKLRRYIAEFVID